MSLSVADRLGPYEILGPLGAGGMGEVYRATDTRLHRDVAVKVSAERFTERFEREARVIASLNHPNICTLFDVGPNYLVMELIEGATLTERIALGPIPLDEALTIAKQIADALEAAHEKGIVHRDLKPGNIKITPDGTVKVLDFGLAKVGGTPTAKTEDSPTISMAATQAGVILGTAAYMSPEQARGKVVDKRADIWAFGVVLYEMLTGERLFKGEDMSDVLASVIKDRLNFDKIPPRVRPLLESCLEKDSKKRLRDIGDAWRLLSRDPEGAGDLTVVPARAHSRYGYLAWASAAVLLLAFVVLAFLHFREAPPPQPAPVRFSLNVPENVTVASTVSISPDGKNVVFPTLRGDPPNRLWIRSLDSLEARSLPGTEGSSGTPFWSPDSRVIVFGANGKLKKIDASGGPPQTLCDVPGQVVGGFWTADRKIIFSTNASALLQVPSGGGVATPITKLDAGEPLHFLPGLLPDGRHIVYMRGGGTVVDRNGIFVGSLDVNHQERENRRLLGDRSGAVFVPAKSPAAKPNDGYILFVREATLLAQPFNARELELSGDPLPVAEGVSSSAANVAGNFSASPNGTVVYRAGTIGQRLTWYDRQGKVVGTTGQPGDWSSLALSPDGKQLVADNQAINMRDLWLMDLARSTSTRFTFDPTGDTAPIWSPDGALIVWGSAREGTINLYVKPSGGAGSEETLLKNSHNKAAHDWSHDGRFVIYHDLDPKTKRDLWLLPMTGDRKPQVFLQTEFNETEAKFSPDGRLVVYQSDESGRYEIYVRPFPAQPGPATKFQVSTGGGAQPRWRADGKELFYVSGEGKLMAVDVTTRPLFKAGLPKPLFDTRVGGIAQDSYRWDVTPDGQRFIVITAPEDDRNAPIHVILNWQAGLKK